MIFIDFHWFSAIFGDFHRFREDARKCSKNDGFSMVENHGSCGGVVQSMIWTILALLGLAERRFWHESPNLGKSWDFDDLPKINENQWKPRKTYENPRKSMKINQNQCKATKTYEKQRKARNPKLEAQKKTKKCKHAKRKNLKFKN